MDKIKIKKGVLLKNHATFKIGGKAKYFFEAEKNNDIIEGIKWARENNTPYFILGWGSNVLFSDQGFDGLIIKNTVKNMAKIKNKIYCSSGLLVSEIVNFYRKNGFAGMEWAGGLPGTLGGAIYGNAGAFGGEIKDNIAEVESLNESNYNILKRENKKCGFGYRKSIFKTNGEIILGAYLNCRKGNKKAISKKIRACVDYRKARQPLEYPSAGSVFKNIPAEKIPKKAREKFKNHVKNDPFPVIPAAAVINEAGLTGKIIGGAEISARHTNFIINKNKASADDIKNLISFAKKEVYKKFKIKLHEEIKIISAVPDNKFRSSSSRRA